MDVTSLLNANSVAAEQQRKLEKGQASKTPTRNRTPWDAGGYSLPINTLSNPTFNTPPSHQNQDDSQNFSASMPSSPRHKFSDSRSSLSSFTSSLQSTTHSRFSSMSTTISGSQPLNNLAENLSPTTSLKIQAMDLAANLPTVESTQVQPRGSVSPTGSLDTLALVAERRIADQEITSSTPEDKMSTTSEPAPNKAAHTSERPSSPSDAILIKRATLPSLRLITGDQELNGAGQAHSL